MVDGVVIEGLRKCFGDFVALNGVDLVVPPGTVGGVLGPNGAGKTTMIRILCTLLAADSGRATVAGFDVMTEPHNVRSVISLTGQYAAVDDDLTGRENLTLIGRLGRRGKRHARARAGELLDRFSLAAAGDKLVKTYSGGMRRRLDLAASLVIPPRVLFLDEPTTGLDPASRQELWDVVRELRAEGTTIMLTTQYLEEADRLADMISVVDHGSIIAEGTAEDLKARIGGEVFELRASSDHGASLAANVLASRLNVDPADITVDLDSKRAQVPIPSGAMSVFGAVRLLDAEGLELDDVTLRRSSLDDVFLALTGRSAQAVAAEPAPALAAEPVDVAASVG
jgi:ABC-2 type transport system ATP-binding protein